MSFANPAALLLSVFIAGLIALYLWERNRQRFDVPSLLLWESIPEATSRRNRFQPDLLFWLQLVALSAPILGLANPYLTGSRRHQQAKLAILVIDASASMEAVEDVGPRFETAREQARRVIQAADSSTRFALIAAARAPTLLNGPATERQSVIGLLEQIEARDVSTDLEPALVMAQNIALQHSGSAEIHVFTDTPRDSVAERWRHNVNWWPVGSTDDNLAIVHVDNARPFLSSQRTNGVYVTIRNFSHRDKHGALTLSVDGREVGTELFTAPPHSERGFLFSNIPTSGVMLASLENGDALAADNRWYAWLPPPRPLRIAVASSDPELHAALTRIATASTGITIAPIDDEPGADLTQVEADLVILHRTTLTELPAIPTLVIAPIAHIVANEPSINFSAVEVVDWNDAHPILRGIDPRLLSPFQAVSSFVPPPSADQVILAARVAGRDLPLLVAGGGDAPRVAIVGPDLAKEGLLTTDGEAALLLFLNLLDWLTDQPDSVPIVRTGHVRALSNAGSIPPEVIDPRGRRVDLPGGPAPFLNFDYTGRYTVRYRDQPTQLIFANFHDIAESNIGRPPSTVHRVSGETAPHRTDTEANGATKTWMYVVGAMFLLVEWFVAARVHDDG
jgi:hypothetical protein